jgi:acyl carrier protein
MSEPATVERLIAILREKFHPESAPVADSTPKSLGLDSLDVINFLFSVEEDTGVAIPDEVIAERGLRTLRDFAAYVDERRAAERARG